MGEAAIISTPDALGALVEALRSAPLLVFDCEFHLEKRYRPELFLVQVSDGHTAVAIDPLRVDLRPLGEILAAEGIVKCFHAGNHDLQLLRDATGQVPINTFDTQIAAGFLGRGARAGFASLVEHYLGHRIDKTQQYSRWDGEVSAEQLQYALDDVRYLMPLVQHIRRELEERGRLRWAEAECEVARRAALHEPGQDEIWRAAKRPGGLDGTQMGIYRELVWWREDVARAENLPPKWVAKYDALLRIARRPPNAAADLRDQRGLPFALASRYWRWMARAIEEGRRRPEPERAPRSKPARNESSDVPSVLAIARRLAASHHEIAATLLAPDPLVRQLVAWAAGDRQAPRPELLDGWRAALIGEPLRRLLDGDDVLRIDLAAPGGVRVLPWSAGSPAADELA